MLLGDGTRIRRTVYLSGCCKGEQIVACASGVVR